MIKVYILIVLVSVYQHYMVTLHPLVQRSAKRLVRGCEKFVPALAYLFYLTLPGSCLARVAYYLADLCSANFHQA